MGSIGSRIKGKAMKVEGKLTGDKVRRGQGAVVEGKGKAEGVIERVGRKAKGAAERVRGKVANKLDKTRAKRGMRRAGVR